MLVSGALMIALGAIAILFPLTAGLTVELFYGVLLIGAAAVQLLSISSGKLGRHLIIAVVFFAMGLLLLLFPMIGLFSVSLITGVGFFFQGIVQLAFAASGEAAFGRWATALSGGVGVFAGGVILYGWPFDSAWVLGVIIGVNLILLGFSILVIRGAIKNTYGPSN